MAKHKALATGPAEAGEAAPYVFSDQVGYLLRRAYQRHLAIFQEESCDPQLTAVQFSTLCALAGNGPSAQSQLVRSTGVDQATIRGIIDRLKARGLVSLSKDAGDARKIIIDITAEGRTVQKAMVERARRVTERTLEPLNPAEGAALIFTLRKIAATEPDGP